MSDIKVRVILSFPHLFVARKAEGSDTAKFSANGLIQENSPEFQIVNQAFENLKAGFPEGWNERYHCAWQRSEKHQGYWEIRTSSKEAWKPHVVDINVQPVVDQSQVYGGCVALLVFNPYIYTTPQRGITAGLNGVQILGSEGALGRLDNRQSADQMFGSVAGGAPSAPQQAHGHVQQPPQQQYQEPAAYGSASAHPADQSFGSHHAPAYGTAAPAPGEAPQPPAGQPSRIMLHKAAGQSYESLIGGGNGWTDELLISNGLMAG